jgi:hypothetical protein
MSENEVPNMFFGVGRWSIPMIITQPSLFYTLPLTFLSFPTQKGKRENKFYNLNPFFFFFFFTNNFITIIFSSREPSSGFIYTRISLEVSKFVIA